MTSYLDKLLSKTDLSQNEAQKAMGEIMAGQWTPSQIAGFLVALRAKGETTAEIAGCALAMRDASLRPSIRADLVLDNCGTGGDGRNSINVSTAAAFVVSGAGYTVAKHGNRAISSKCGSADVLEELGVKIECPLAIVEQCINDVGIGFMFAPAFHPAMRFAAPTRKELGVRTVFNMLGPLTNPAMAQIQLMGVFKPEMTSVMAQVLKRMGSKAALVVHSEGWDEITLHGKTHVTELCDGKLKSYTLQPKDFGLSKVSAKELAGGDRSSNAQTIQSVLKGADHPVAHVIVANAAALIWITERGFFKRKNFTLKEAVARARHSISSGEALHRLQKMVDVSQTIE